MKIGVDVRDMSQHRCRAAALIVLCLLPASPAPAQDAARTVIVHTAEGQRLAGQVASLEDGKLLLAGMPVELKLADLSAIEWPAQPVRRDAADPLLLFANGDQLRVRPRGMTAESLAGGWVQFTAWPELKVPLERLRACVFRPPATAAERTRVFDGLMNPSEKMDKVLLKNGDTLGGEFQSLGEAGLALKTAGGQSTLAVENVVALGFNPELTLAQPFRGEGALVAFIDGSRLHARNLKITTERTFACETLFGATLDVPLSALARLDLLGGRVVYLSDLEPASDKSQAYLSVAWPFRRDRSVSGGPLLVRGVEYAKGLGVHSRSELSWKLDGQHKKFLATVGVDDEAQGQGSVIFRVALDGTSVFASPVLTGRSEPLVLEPIDVSRAKTLTLIVEFATQGDIRDRADWCAARLVK